MSFCTFFASCPGFLRKEKQMNSDIVSPSSFLSAAALSHFSATETSFISLNRIRMKNMAEKGDKRAELVLKLLENLISVSPRFSSATTSSTSDSAPLPRCFLSSFSAAIKSDGFTDRNHYRGPDLRQFPRKALQKNLRRRSPNFPHRFSTF